MTAQKSQSMFAKAEESKDTLPSELFIFIALGDKAGAMTELEKAYAAYDPHLLNLKVDPHFDSLRSDPRFQDWIRRVGL